MQVPFSAWLPAAIAAPTPVSALVHSSTLVTAGVYLLMRAGGSIAPILDVVLFLGATTTIIAGVRALYEIDIKKVVALSTLSQLGIIICAIGLGLPKVAFFHLLAHAFFKAILFIGVGNTIHLSDSFQDLRQAGPLLRSSPATLGFIIVSNLRLCGVPFIAGFYSKDAIIECAASRGRGAFR